MKMLQGTIVNIAGYIYFGVPDVDVVPDAVKNHDDCGELHTKSGIYITLGCHGIIYVGSSGKR